MKESNITQVSNVKKTPIDEMQVREYLLENPDFFKNNPSILHYLELNHFKHVEKVSSLIEYQVKTLKRRNRELQLRYLFAIKAARINENTLKKLHYLALSVTAAECAKTLTQYLFKRLVEEFAQIAQVNIYFERSLYLKNKVGHPVNELKLMTINHTFFKNRHFYCGPLTQYIVTHVLNKPADLSSIAILPLRSNKRLFGYIVLTGKDQDAFQEEQGGLFLTMLAELISEAYTRLLED
ncbi:MAG: DUF484 family protein [Pseudomonadota bacterium]